MAEKQVSGFRELVLNNGVNQECNCKEEKGSGYSRLLAR